MCNNCYHSTGRNKKAWKCNHTEKALYALGVCQSCYQSKYSTKAKKLLEANNNNSSSITLDEKEDDKIFSDDENFRNNINEYDEEKNSDSENTQKKTLDNINYEITSKEKN